MNIDPDRWDAALGAGPGAVLYALYHVSVLIRTGQPVTVRDMVLVATNLICALICGVILAYAFAGGLVSLVPWVQFRDPWIAGLACGAFGWELLPLFYRVATGLARKRASTLGGDE